MPNLRDILNEIKWNRELEKAEIWYIHRGAPNNTGILTGKDIVKIGKSFVETHAAAIPFHRIFKIIYEDEILFER